MFSSFSSINSSSEDTSSSLSSFIYLFSLVSFSLSLVEQWPLGIISYLVSPHLLLSSSLLSRLGSSKLIIIFLLLAILRSNFLDLEGPEWSVVDFLFFGVHFLPQTWKGFYYLCISPPPKALGFSRVSLLSISSIFIEVLGLVRHFCWLNILLPRGLSTRTCLYKATIRPWCRGDHAPLSILMHNEENK